MKPDDLTGLGDLCRSEGGGTINEGMKELKNEGKVEFSSERTGADDAD